MKMLAFREPSAAQAGGYVLAAACLLVAVGLLFHPPPSGGFDEKPSVLQNTPWWGVIHIAIAAGFVLCVLGGFLMLFAVGNPLFLAGLCGATFLEVRYATFGLPRWLAWAGLVSAILSWGRGIGSASGMYFLEPLIFANIPAFLWLGYYGLRISWLARKQVAEGQGAAIEP